MDPFLIWIVVAVLVLIGFIVNFLIREADYSLSFKKFIDNGDDLWGSILYGLMAGITWPLCLTGLILVSPVYLVWKLNHVKAKLAKSDKPKPFFTPERSPRTYREHMERLTGEPLL